MCRELDALRQSIVAYAKEFDARCLTPAEAAKVVRICAQAGASIASIKALAAARSADGNTWQNEGYRSAADQLARQSGTTPSAAKRALDTGRRMAQQPEVAEAALSGELSADQARVISEGVEADPSKANELIEKARRSSLGELCDEVAKVKAASQDPDERRRRLHQHRALKRWTDLEGALQGRLTGLPEDGAKLWQMIDPLRRALIVARRKRAPDQPNEHFEALDYDALMMIAGIATGHEDGELGMADLLELGLFPQLADLELPHLHDREDRSATDDSHVSPPRQSTLEPDPTLPTGGKRQSNKKRRRRLAGSPARLTIRVDLDTLLRGAPLDGELCEIVGYGPISVSTIEDLVANENPFIVAALTRGEELAGVYHHRRRPNSRQQSGLDFLYPTCAAEGCNVKVGLQYDHQVDWSKTHYTVFDLLDRLCVHHHRLKTRNRWALVEGRGKRAFVPPDDPRHPDRPNAALAGTGPPGGSP